MISEPGSVNGVPAVVTGPSGRGVVDWSANGAAPSCGAEDLSSTSSARPARRPVVNAMQAATTHATACAERRESAIDDARSTVARRILSATVASPQGAVTASPRCGGEQVQQPGWFLAHHDNGEIYFGMRN